MSKELFNLASRLQLPPAAKAVLRELAWFASPKGDAVAWPSVATLAARTGLGRRTVQDMLRLLERCSAIKAVDGFSKGGRKHTTRYRLTLVDTDAMTRKAWDLHRQNTEKRARRSRRYPETKSAAFASERARRSQKKGAALAPEQYLIEKGQLEKTERTPPFSKAKNNAAETKVQEEAMRRLTAKSIEPTKEEVEEHRTRLQLFKGMVAVERRTLSRR